MLAVLMAHGQYEEGSERARGVSQIQCHRTLERYGMFLHKNCMRDIPDSRLDNMLTNMRVRCDHVEASGDVRGVLKDTMRRAEEISGPCARSQLKGGR